MSEVAWTAREHGTVRSFGDATGYGFIRGDNGDGDIYVRAVDIEGRVAQVGDRVAFRLLRQPDGRRRALNVRII